MRSGKLDGWFLFVALVFAGALAEAYGVLEKPVFSGEHKSLIYIDAV